LRLEADAAARVDHVEHLVEVELRHPRGHHHLCRRSQRDRVEEVVEQLGGVAGAGRAHVEDTLAEGLKQRAHAL